jgi:hypothetical protein
MERAVGVGRSRGMRADAHTPSASSNTITNGQPVVEIPLPLSVAMLASQRPCRSLTDPVGEGTKAGEVRGKRVEHEIVGNRVPGDGPEWDDGTLGQPTVARTDARCAS